MQLIKIAGVALALLMVTGTAAATPGAPAAQADENTDGTDAAANETATADDDTTAGPADRAPDRPGSAADRGPPVDLPSQVPDFVGDSHDTIGEFLDDDLVGSLGEAISDLTPDDEGTDGNESSTPGATPTARADA